MNLSDSWRLFGNVAAGDAQPRGDGSKKGDEMTYVDGFVAAVPTDKREAFLKHARDAWPVFKDHGALSQVECWGDEVPKGELTDFHRAVKAEADETVVFSWIMWPDKETRDAGLKKAMEDPRFQPDQNPMPFDGKRMIFGGFEMILERHKGQP